MVVSTQVYRLARLSSSASHPTRHHTKFTKTSTKTRKRKNQLDGTHVVPSPVPLTKFSKINEIHEKGDRGGRIGFGVSVTLGKE